jgi:pilus assembly protein Flp/PilA
LQSSTYKHGRASNARQHGVLARGYTPQGKETVVRNLIWTFIGNERGATAIEYGLIAAGIAVAIIAVVQGLGTSLNSTFTSVSSSLK